MKTATFAAACVAGSAKASPAMNSDMVKPMPASAPAPSRWRQPNRVGAVELPPPSAPGCSATGKPLRSAAS